MDLEDGWVAVSNVNDGVGIAFIFSKEVFPTVGFFVNRGADRGHYSLAVEPCTGYPIKLTDAIENGTARELKPGESFASTMRVRLYQGLSSVSKVGAILDSMAKAAGEGTKSTVTMVSRVGRSSYLGERSRGTIDPGAMFIYIFLNALEEPLPQ